MGCARSRWARPGMAMARPWRGGLDLVIVPSAHTCGCSGSRDRGMARQGPSENKRVWCSVRPLCAFASGTRAFPVDRDTVRARAGLGCQGRVGTRRWCSKHAIGVALGVRGLGLVAARKVFDEMPQRAGHVALRRCGCACACHGVRESAALGGFHERARRAWPWQGHGVATAVAQRHQGKRRRAAGSERGTSGSYTRTRDRGS